MPLVLQITVVVVLITGVYRMSKGGGGSAVSELSKANEYLTNRMNQQGVEIRDLKMHNTELEARTKYADYLSNALTPVVTWMAHHEERAEARHQQMSKEHEAVISLLSKLISRVEDLHKEGQ